MSRFELSKFSPSPDQELICGICMNVFDVPWETPCRHVFCRDCLQTALDDNPRCPACRSICSSTQPREVVPLVQNLINKLTMQCDNRDQGCTDLVQKEFFLDHVKSCQYMTVQCRYDQCGESILKKDQEEHETKMCLYRDRICPNGCGLLLPQENLTSHNCMEALLALVKDLKEQNSKLQNQMIELQRECTQANSAVTAMKLSSTARSYDYSDSDITSVGFYSHSPSNSDFSEELSDLEFDSEYVSLGAASTQQAYEKAMQKQIKVYGDCQQTDEYVSRSRAEATNNTNEGQLQSQGVSGAADITLESHRKDSLNENAAEANSCLHNDGPISSCMIGLSGGVIVPQGGSDGQLHKRCPEREEIDSGCGKKIKLSPASELCLDSRAEMARSGGSQGNDISKTEQQQHSKKHPRGHKRSCSTCCPVVQTPGGDQSCPAATSENPSRESPQAHNVESSAEGDQVRGGRLNQDNQWPASRRGPMTRSKGCGEHVMLKESVVISNVRVPPSFNYLLDKYAEEDASSDDEVWSPKKG